MTEDIKPEEHSENWPETAERFVAFFDIMGFKDLIYRQESLVEELFERLNQFTFIVGNRESAAQEMGIDPVLMGQIKVSLFSDSILLVSNSTSQQDRGAIIHASQLLLKMMFESKIPIKGAIACGSFTADFKRSVFYGRPLIDAYELQEHIKFYGAVLHHTAQDYFDDLVESMLKPLRMSKEQVPVKPSGKISYRMILPLDIGEEAGCFPGGDSRLENYFEPFYLTVSGPPRAYVDNSVAVYKIALSRLDD